MPSRPPAAWWSTGSWPQDIRHALDTYTGLTLAGTFDPDPAAGRVTNAARRY
ncbi:hypothetical protein [Streptomyces scopuliridis]|uniref:hypothetical protein n=1 Tax=Streptomyces scopuliridis TaxID=452529 RepID=UPI0036849F36